ncbi:MAG: acetyl-CoA C-acetyltransferase [Magnetococcales bacterium]|nr:acetyl-CoA C-acetyltransferase [Magnetococcales bacterium]
MNSSPNHDNRRPVYLVDGCRTPFLKVAGARNPFSAADLAALSGRLLLLRQPLEPGDLDEVILGCVVPSPDEANVARVAALRMGCPKQVTAMTVQRNCASGMQAVDTAARSIALGMADLILAGGTEAMSHAPLQWSPELVDWLGRWRGSRTWVEKLKALAALRPAWLNPVVVLLRGLTDPTVGLSMGQTAEILAHRFNIARDSMDRFALQSHARLGQAVDKGSLAAELVPLMDREGQLFPEDQGLRRNSSLESLSQLKPVFDRTYGLLTAGNSAQITDGACWLLLASEEAVARHGLQPLAQLDPAVWAGVAPEQMGLGPVHAIDKLLRKTGLNLDDIDLWEINEAFAAQVLACVEALADESYCQTELGRDAPLGRIDPQRLNVDGGAISIGHPVGASGARIILHLAHQLKQAGQGSRGVASLCIGGGQGGAMMLQAV